GGGLGKQVGPVRFGGSEQRLAVEPPQAAKELRRRHTRWSLHAPLASCSSASRNDAACWPLVPTRSCSLARARAAALSIRTTSSSVAFRSSAAASARAV